MESPSALAVGSLHTPETTTFAVIVAAFNLMLMIAIIPMIAMVKAKLTPTIDLYAKNTIIYFLLLLF